MRVATRDLDGRRHWAVCGLPSFHTVRMDLLRAGILPPDAICTNNRRAYAAFHAAFYLPTTHHPTHHPSLPHTPHTLPPAHHTHTPHHRTTTPSPTPTRPPTSPPPYPWVLFTSPLPQLYCHEPPLPVVHYLPPYPLPCCSTHFPGWPHTITSHLFVWHASDMAFFLHVLCS